MEKAITKALIGNTRRFIHFFFFATLVAIIFNSCSKEDSADVNQDKIWTEYAVYYDKNDDKTHVTARFRFGNPSGTLLELVDSSGASVKFNGTPIPYSIFWGAHHVEFAGNITTGTFLYTNTEGTTYTNSIPSGTDIIAYPAGFDTIVKSQAQTFSWTGNPLSANQKVGVYVGTWAWDKDALFYTEDDGASNLIMGTQAKSGLTVGQATVYMLREVQNNSINGTSKGGLIRYSYRPIDKSVVVVE